MTGRPPSGLEILFVAFKDLSRNSRVFRQAAALIDRGHRVTVYCLEAPDPALVARVPEIVYRHRGVIDLPFPAPIKPGKSHKWRGREIIRPLRNFWRASVHMLMSRKYHFAKFCRREARGKRFDVVVVHDHHSMIAAAAVAFFSRARFAVDLVEVPYHQIPPHLGKIARTCRRIENVFERQLLRRCSLTFTVSTTLAKYLARRRFGKNIRIIRNFQHRRSIAPAAKIRADAGISDGEFIMLFLNNIYVGDGMDFIIRALPKVNAAVRLVILGAFPLKDEKEAHFKLAEDLGVAERIVVLPLVPQSTLLDYISGADFGIIARQKTSLNVRVSLPNRLGELAMARLPIACCRCSDIKRLVKTHNIGLVFDETNCDDIAAKINDLADAETIASYRDNIESSIEALSWEGEAATFTELLETMASPKKEGR